MREKTEDIPATAYFKVQAYRAETVHPDPECLDRSVGGTGSGGDQKPGPPDTGIPDGGVSPGFPSCPVFYLPNDRDTTGCCVHKVHQQTSGTARDPGCTPRHFQKQRDDQEA